jgi:1-acyl-sn-glycerol-3-phosphate acyltransferase
MAFLTLAFSLRVQGRRHIPRKGPALLIANHESFFDPVLVAMASPRPLCYLARKTLFKNRAFGWFIRSLRAVPIDQEGLGKDGLKDILGQLQAGRAVLVFPEGHRTRDGKMRPLMPGVQLLIKRVQAPIVPIGIAGAYAAWPHGQKLPYLAPIFLPPGLGTIGVAVGRPLAADRYAEMPREQLLTELYGELQKMRARADEIRLKPRHGNTV